VSLFRKKSVDGILAQASAESDHQLARHLGVRDLTAFGIAAIVGAGIFSTIGKASADGGPGVILLFIFTAIACSFAAFAYAEFASLIPVSGSAYTYSYVAFGELFAWIIGWALIMEYGIGNVTVAISWSDYFTSLYDHVTGSPFPPWLALDYFTAKAQFTGIGAQIAAGQTADVLSASGETSVMMEGYRAWQTAPMLGSLRIIFDLPALVINLFITAVVYRGIRESRNASNVMVAIKLAVVLLVILVGAFYVDTTNWNPFLPNGAGGVLAGISAVFFAYIGFDAISTTAEECRNPQRDLPRGILASIVICTLLYVAVALVITGMVHYTELDVGDPLAYVFEKIGGIRWLGGVVSVSAVVAMASVMLVFQLGQPRIFMSMSRDGLLPPAFARVHPKYRTPSFSTIVTGLLVAIPLFFVDMEMVTDMCSAGTLFAFCLVCAGVLKLRMDPNAPRAKFTTPYVNGKFIVPVLFVCTLAYLTLNREAFESHLSIGSVAQAFERIPVVCFLVGFLVVSWLAFRHNFSLIPSLGFLCCFYMLSQLGHKNWLYFSVWLTAGLVIYFAYGRSHSNLARSTTT
jgi:basic amino acid/polyamine antiporter, APA family